MIIYYILDQMHMNFFLKVYMKGTAINSFGDMWNHT